MRALLVRREHGVDLESVVGRSLGELQAPRPPVGRVWHRRQRVQVHRASCCTGHRDHERAVVVGVAVQERARDELDGAASELGQHRRQRHQLLRCRVVRRHAATIVRHVQLELRRREPDRAVGKRGPYQRLHCCNLVIGCRALRRVVPHDVATDCAVPDVGAHVHADPALQPTEEVAERSAAERHAFGERVGGHAFDPAQHLEEPRKVGGLRRREGEPAVAGEQRGHAVP